MVIFLIPPMAVYPKTENTLKCFNDYHAEYQQVQTI